jgi:hypothetical protein
VDPKLLLSEKGMYLGLYEIKIGFTVQKKKKKKKKNKGSRSGWVRVLEFVYI